MKHNDVSFEVLGSFSILVLELQWFRRLVPHSAFWRYLFRMRMHFSNNWMLCFHSNCWDDIRFLSIFDSDSQFMKENHKIISMSSIIKNCSTPLAQSSWANKLYRCPLLFIFVNNSIRPLYLVCIRTICQMKSHRSLYLISRYLSTSNGGRLFCKQSIHAQASLKAITHCLIQLKGATNAHIKCNVIYEGL